MYRGTTVRPMSESRRRDRRRQPLRVPACPPRSQNWPGISARRVARRRGSRFDRRHRRRAVVVDPDRRQGRTLPSCIDRRSPQWVHTVGTGVDAFPFEVTLRGADPHVFSRHQRRADRRVGVRPDAGLRQGTAGDVYLDDTTGQLDPRHPTSGSVRCGARPLVILGLGGIGAEVARLSLRPSTWRSSACGGPTAPTRRIAGMTVVNDIAEVVSRGRPRRGRRAVDATRRDGQPVRRRALRRQVKPGRALLSTSLVARSSIRTRSSPRSTTTRVARASLDVCKPEAPARRPLDVLPPEGAAHPAHVSWVGSDGAYEKHDRDVPRATICASVPASPSKVSGRRRSRGLLRAFRDVVQRTASTRSAAEVRNWGRWGDDDRLGTLNLLTDDAVAHAAATIRSGRRVLDGDRPRPPPAHRSVPFPVGSIRCGR